MKRWTFFHPNIYMYHFTNEKYENKSHNFFFPHPGTLWHLAQQSLRLHVSYCHTYLLTCIFVFILFWQFDEWHQKYEK